MLKEIMKLYKGTEKVAPVAEGINRSNNGMLDCNCVDGDCCNCD